MTAISEYREDGWRGEAWPVRAAAPPQARPIDEREPIAASRRRGMVASLYRLLKKALLAVLLAGCLGYGLLFALHLAPLVMVTGSMGKTIPAGSLVVDRAIPPSELKNGDVITFQKPIGAHGLDTHRIIGIDRSGPVARYQTKGDANAEPDPWMISFPPRQKANRVVFHLPYLGWALLYLRMPLVRTLIPAAVMLTILTTFLKALGAYGSGAATVTRTKPAKGKKGKRVAVDLVPAELLAAGSGARATKALPAPVDPPDVDDVGAKTPALAAAEAWAAELWPAEEAVRQEEPLQLEPASAAEMDWPREDWPRLVWPTEAEPAELMPGDVWPTEPLKAPVVTTESAPSEVWPEGALPTTLAAASIEPTDVRPTEAHPRQLALEPGDPTEVSATEPEPPSDDPVPFVTVATPYAWKPSEPQPLTRWRPGVGVGFALGLAAMVMARRTREQ